MPQSSDDLPIVDELRGAGTSSFDADLAPEGQKGGVVYEAGLPKGRMGLIVAVAIALVIGFFIGPLIIGLFGGIVGIVFGIMGATAGVAASLIALIVAAFGILIPVLVLIAIGYGLALLTRRRSKS